MPSKLKGLTKIFDLLRGRFKIIIFMLLAPAALVSYRIIAGMSWLLMAATFLPIFSSILLVVLFYCRRGRLRSKASRKIDEELILSILHMYVVSQGEAGPSQLVRSVADVKEYGYYSLVFSKIYEIAKEFGYGFAKAMAHVSSFVKPPLKDILIRCAEALSTPEPKEYLELENSSLFEEYSGYYLRAIESIRTLGGVYGTFQSVAVFMIMTLDLMTGFINNPNIAYYSYIVSSAAVIIMFLGFKSVIPKETLIYIDREDPPRLYMLFRISTVIAMLSVIPAVYLSISINPSIGFMIFGSSLMLPGIIAYKFESYITKIDEYYPTFIKALCENMASTASVKSALAYVLHMELGPLRTLLEKALARIRLGIRIEKAMNLLSSEASSFRVYTMNRMLLDSINYGGNLIEVGKILGDSCIKFLEFRKRRDSVAKSFKSVVFILQPVTVALLIILTHLCKFFSRSLVSLPFFSFGEIPTGVVELGNILMILLVTSLNALALKEAEGGFWGKSLLYIGLLMIISGVSWLTGEKLMDLTLGQVLSGFEKLI